MGKDVSVDIDDEMDFRFAELLMEKKDKIDVIY